MRERERERERGIFHSDGVITYNSNVKNSLAQNNVVVNNKIYVKHDIDLEDFAYRVLMIFCTFLFLQI